MSYELAEEERQAVLLAIARLSLDRPGWRVMLGEIADKLRPGHAEPFRLRDGTALPLPNAQVAGRELFEEFRLQTPAARATEQRLRDLRELT